jgi:hypothetical protein
VGRHLAPAGSSSKLPGLGIGGAGIGRVAGVRCSRHSE